jgi:hypothetical protein
MIKPSSINGTVEAHFSWGESETQRQRFKDLVDSQGFRCTWKTDGLRLGFPWNENRTRWLLSVSVVFP